jgi:hypothetical protein
MNRTVPLRLDKEVQVRHGEQRGFGVVKCIIGGTNQTAPKLEPAHIDYFVNTAFRPCAAAQSL